MSVRLNDRGHHIREVYEAAQSIVKYTLDRCVSENCFPKSQRWLLANPIANEATSYYIALNKARESEGIARERVYNHALDAREHLIALIALVELANEKYNFKDRFIYWTENLYKNRELLEKYLGSYAIP